MFRSEFHVYITRGEHSCQHRLVEQRENVHEKRETPFSTRLSSFLKCCFTSRHFDVPFTVNALETKEIKCAQNCLVWNTCYRNFFIAKTEHILKKAGKWDKGVKAVFLPRKR